MTQKTKHPWEDQVKALFNPLLNDYTSREVSVTIEEYNTNSEVQVSQMYEYLPLTFDTLMKLSEIFGTKEFEVNNYSTGGCETCDYGSSYSHVFSVPKKG